MKVLIANGNSTERVRIAADIKHLGYEFEQAVDGTKAVQLLVAEDAPQIALLSWTMDGLGGLEVCRKVRDMLSNQLAHRIQPHLIVILADDARERIKEAMEAGADDFLDVTCRKSELRVRLRMAERTVELQTELQTHIKELERVLRRHNLLREVVSKLKRGDERGIASGDLSYKEQKSIFSEKVSNIKTLGSLHSTLGTLFSQLGCGQATSAKAEGMALAKDLNHLVWTPTYLDGHAMWIDIKAELNDASARKLYEEMLGIEPETEEDLNDALGEMLNMVQGALKMTLAKEDVSSKTLTIPRVLSAFGVKLPPTLTGNFQKCEVTIGEIKVLITISENDSPIFEKKLNDVAAHDILMEAFYSPLNKETEIFPAGTILGDYNFKKLKKYVDLADKGASITVVEPSRLARRCLPVGL
ncbi:MAG: response regulator [Deltaproteobacteria bacterium]|nr:response regulator [Deltaproteobacteria bacterium]